MKILPCLPFALACLLAVLIGCDPAPTPPSSSRASEVDSAIQPLPSASQAAHGSLPAIGGPPGYLTSESCRECHTNEHASWHASFHRTMTQPVTAQTVLADFNQVRLETGGERFTLSRTNDEHWVAIEDLDEIAATPPGQSPPPPVHVRLAMLTGSHHMQVFWLPAGFGNAQIGFPFTWLVQDQRWAPRNSVFIRDPAAPAPVETWNMSCIRCHVTAGQPRPRPEQETFETRVGEFGIACEACHGPGERHVQLMHQFAETRRARPQAPKPADLAVCQPAHLDHVRASHVCGQCHGMKWFDRHEGWTEDGFRYRPGDDLESTTPIIRPSRVQDQPWVQAIVQKQPQLFREFFWPDGMIRVAGREYNGLLETACYQRGKMSCLTCHSLHEFDSPNDQLKPKATHDRVCFDCHQETRFAGPQHTHHAGGSSGSSCYNCHMPHTTYALLGGIRQHQIDSPRAATTLATGRPNACNLCHLDRSLAWTAQHLQSWYQQPSPDLGLEHRTVSAAARQLLAGDAGQRALIAWHMGWEPALAASGPGWMAPLLTRLLDDPYSAVRYIAAQSLRRQSVGIEFAYDFAAEPASLSNARKTLLSQLTPSPIADAERRAALLQTMDGTTDELAASAIEATRDQRPMHLRE
ncbi:MAG: cytochrome c3 family protein [Verrucomicrobiales bacterium]|nr:cytochrome c3 family protein [Verrucomicrobiales bacterium]